MNSMYMDALDLSTHNGEADLILTWLAAQLALAKEEGRKVIIIDHVYAGSNFEPPKLWYDDYNTRFFDILRTYHNQVIIEVYGHDHYADLRYHSSDNVASLPNVEEDFYFHNMFVAPGVTPYEGTNSGVSMF